MGVLYLLLTIIASASMTVALRLFQKEDGNRYGLLLGNYLTCIVLAFLMLPEKDLLPEDAGLTLLCGIADGVLFVVSLVLMQINIRRNGAVMTSAFSRLGLLVPLTLGLVVWGEQPNRFQLAGIALVILALALLNSGEQGGKAGPSGSRSSLPLLLLLLVFFGAGDAMAKVFERVGNRSQDALLFFYVFLTAGILCAGLAWAEQRKTGKHITARDMLAGIAVGIPNYFSSSLLLKALTSLPSFLVYPSVSTGSIVVVTIASVLLFHETIEKRKWVCLGVIAAALVLLNS